MGKIHIPQTTLFSVCWGEEYFVLTLKAIVASLKTASFDKVIVVTDNSESVLNKYKDVLNTQQISIIERTLSLPKDEDTNESRTQFSNVFIKMLDEFCDQEYILTIQPDSCIINPDKWLDEYFKYDYIGAAWPIDIVKAVDMASNKIQNINNFVGNGGFSLRSKKYVATSLSMPTLHKNEDLNLCVFNYDSMIKNGIKFAPIDIALSFSVEHPILNHKIYDRKFLLTYNSFGFHGEFNIAGMKYIHQNSKEVL
jgi:hypothetical protein